MNLGITSLLCNYSLGGLYPWNSSVYTGGLHPLSASYMNGFGVDFSSILNRAYNTVGKGYTIEVDETGQISKITVKDNGEQAVSSTTAAKQQEVSKGKMVTEEQQEYHLHRLGGCCKRHTI